MEENKYNHAFLSQNISTVIEDAVTSFSFVISCWESQETRVTNDPSFNPLIIIARSFLFLPSPLP